MGVQKMGNPETTNQLPPLSLESQGRIEHLHFDARSRLRKTLDTLTYGRSERLQIHVNPKVHEIVIAYAAECSRLRPGSARLLNLSQSAERRLC
jgi:hypothetical protein